MSRSIDRSRDAIDGSVDFATVGRLRCAIGEHLLATLSCEIELITPMFIESIP